jgi:8-oxo-dGTP pyrophosphatase MutT (NUDIX family)
MMDESDNFVGVAAKELEEETGIKILKSDLKRLG